MSLDPLKLNWKDLRPLSVQFSGDGALRTRVSDELFAEYASLFPEGTNFRSEYLSAVTHQTIHLQGMFEDIREAANSNDIPESVPPDDVLCGLYPTGDFNAIIVRRHAGILILVNIGLIELIATTAFLAIATWDFGAESEILFARHIDEDDARAVFRSLIDAFRAGSTIPVDWLPDLSDEHIRVANLVFWSGVDFVIAHELAHLMLGHLAFAPGPDGKLARRFYNRIEELNADSLAGDILRNLSHRWTHPEAQYLGIVAVCQLSAELHVVDRIRVRIDRTGAGSDDHDWETHPHPTERLGSALSSAHPEGYAAHLPLCDSLYWTFRRLRGRVPDVEPDRLACEKVKSLAEDADYDELNAILGRSVDGVVSYDGDVLKAFLGQHFERAQANVAAVALYYLSHSWVVNARAQRHLAMIYMYFSLKFLDGDASSDARRFDELLRAAIPDIDEVIAFALTAIEFTDAKDV